MELLASLFVGKPLNIMLIAGAFLAIYFIVRLTDSGSDRHPYALLVVAAIWILYTVWEWLVVTLSPEANIRVDLLLIWPIILIVSICFIIRAFR